METRAYSHSPSLKNFGQVHISPREIPKHQSWIARTKKGLFSVLAGAVLSMSVSNARADDIPTEQETIPEENVVQLAPISSGGHVEEDEMIPVTYVKNTEVKNTENSAWGYESNAYMDTSFREVLRKFSAVFGYPPETIEWLLTRESGPKWNTGLVSIRGAMGIFQATPDLIQDIRGENGGRGMRFYTDVFLKIPARLIMEIPVKKIRESILSFRTNPGSRSLYSQMIQTITSDVKNPYASMFLGFSCLYGFERGLSTDWEAIVTNTKKALLALGKDPASLSEINRIRRGIGKPIISPEHLKTAAAIIGKTEARIIMTLTRYNGGKKSLEYPITLGALDSQLFSQSPAAQVSYLDNGWKKAL